MFRVSLLCISSVTAELYHNMEDKVMTQDPIILFLVLYSGGKYSYS